MSPAQLRISAYISQWRIHLAQRAARTSSSRKRRPYRSAAAPRGAAPVARFVRAQRMASAPARSRHQRSTRRRATAAAAGPRRSPSAPARRNRTPRRWRCTRGSRAGATVASTARKTQEFGPQDDVSTMGMSANAVRTRFMRGGALRSTIPRRKLSTAPSTAARSGRRTGGRASGIPGRPAAGPCA